MSEKIRNWTPGSKSRKECVIEKMQNQSGSEPDQPRILSYTHTRPHKSRTECVIEKMQNQRGSETDQPCILSYTHTRPHKSRKKTAWENWNTKVNQTSAKHSQGMKH